MWEFDQSINQYRWANRNTSTMRLELPLGSKKGVLTDNIFSPFFLPWNTKYFERVQTKDCGQSCRLSLWRSSHSQDESLLLLLRFKNKISVYVGTAVVIYVGYQKMNKPGWQIYIYIYIYSLFRAFLGCMVKNMYPALLAWPHAVFVQLLQMRRCHK